MRPVPVDEAWYHNMLGGLKCGVILDLVVVCDE
jgi:hypothetical protein